MSERLDAHLDGDLPSDDLSAAERAQVAAFEARIAQMRATLSERSPTDMDSRVMRRIAELGLEPLPARSDNVARRAIRGLWSRQEIRLRWRPAYPLAAAAVLAAVLLAPRSEAPMAPPVAETTAVAGAPIYVQFRLHTPSAQQVALAGSFSSWEPVHALQQVADGVWTVLLPMRPGVHDYAFVIDGQRWVPDPYAPQIDDGFGGRNSRLTVLAPTDL